MRYKIKNISRDRINILGRIIQPKQEILTFNIDPYRKMINEGFFTVETDDIELEIRQKPDIINQNNIVKTNELNNDYSYNNLNNEVDNTNNKNNNNELNFIKIATSNIDKKELLQSLFHFYIDRELTEEDLNNVKQFYNEIGLINNISGKDKELFNNANNYEELITVLLNNIYPQIIKD